MAPGTEPDGLDQAVVVPLRQDADVVRARHAVREQAIALGLDLVSQTKIITAASELGRNTVIHGHGGSMRITTVRRPGPVSDRVGLQLVFSDDGPGIPDLDRAMTGGWSSGDGLGLGLPGSRRLVHDFDVRPGPDGGTVVTAVIWRRS